MNVSRNERIDSNSLKSTCYSSIKHTDSKAYKYKSIEYTPESIEDLKFPSISKRQISLENLSNDSKGHATKYNDPTHNDPETDNLINTSQEKNKDISHKNIDAESNYNTKNEKMKFLEINYLVIILVAFSQGIQSISELAVIYLYKDDFKLQPYEVSRIAGLMSIPWIIKPIYGFISDSFPIFDYRRKPYLFVTGCIVASCWFLMGLWVDSINKAIIVLFITSSCTAFYNVIGEALVIELSQIQKELDPDAGAKNVSLYFFTRSSGSLIASIISGYLIEILSKRHVFLITAMFPSLLVIASFLLVEKPASLLRIEYLQKKQAENEKELKEKNSTSFNEYGTLRSDAIVSTRRENNMASENFHITHDDKFSEVKDQFNLFIGFIKTPTIYKPVAFIILYMATPSYSDPMFYFYTTVLKFNPIVMGRLKLVYGIATITGIYIYNKYLKNISFKKIILVTTLMSVFFNMLSIIVVERINLKYGISDYFFCLTTDALTTALAEINMMPLLVLACNICPKNIEGTLYAFLMSVSNFGGLLSTQFGSALSSKLAITNSNFANLSILIIIANVFLLLPMPALYLIDESKYLNRNEPATDEENINENKENSEQNYKNRNKFININNENTLLSFEKNEKNSERENLRIKSLAVLTHKCSNTCSIGCDH